MTGSSSRLDGGTTIRTLSVPAGAAPLSMQGMQTSTTSSPSLPAPICASNRQTSSRCSTPTTPRARGDSLGHVRGGGSQISKG